MKPKLRCDAYYDIQSALVEALERTNKQNGLLRSCLNCDMFNEQLEKCAIAPTLKIPARVIAYGCPSWADKDEIPF